MNEKQFRAYEFMRYFIEDTKIGDKLNTGEQMINLADVRAYYKFNFKNQQIDGTEGKEFTCIETFTNSYVAQVSYEEFRGIHTEFLLDTQDYDPRSLLNNPLKPCLKK